VPTGNTTDNGRQRLSGGTLPDSIGETPTTPRAQSKWLSSSASQIVGRTPTKSDRTTASRTNSSSSGKTRPQTYSCAYFERDDMTLQEA
jgi:cyclopropane-fatty-acyl-phospholipid synthase